MSNVKDERLVAPAVGQIWKDCDKRMSDRYLRIDKIFDGCEHVETTRVIPAIKDPDGWVEVGNRRHRIAVRRMRPASTGYVLFRDINHA